MQRTIKLILKPTKAQAGSLADTTVAFTSAFNLAAKIGWDEGISNATKLHYAAYYAVKGANPTLVSDLVNQSRVKAAEALRSAVARIKKGRKASCPISLICPPRFNAHTFKVDWATQTVKLSTTDGRQLMSFTVPHYATKYTGGKVATADLIFKSGKWHLHVVITVAAPEMLAMSEVIGVDLGLVQPAVTSAAKFLGGKHWREVENRFFRLRRKLQAKGSPSARRHLRKIGARRMRFRKDCDHVLSKRIAHSVESGATIVIENLTDIRTRTKIQRKTETSRRVHSWSFAQLRGFIEYKAEERGCMVVAIDPRHTSQTCSSCGHVARNNRRSRSRFHCHACGFQLHADLNAARNIAAKYLASGGIPAAGGRPVNAPIVLDLGHRDRNSEHKPSALADGR